MNQRITMIRGMSLRDATTMYKTDKNILYTIVNYSHYIVTTFNGVYPTPVLLPGKSHGWRSLVGCRQWGH